MGNIKSDKLLRLIKPLLILSLITSLGNALNIEKLGLKNILIQNISGSKQRLRITSSKQCTTCTDFHKQLTHISLASQEARIFKDHNQSIKKISTSSNKYDIYFDSDNINSSRVYIKSKEALNFQIFKSDLEFTSSSIGITDGFSSYLLPQEISTSMFYKFLWEQFEQNKPSKQLKALSKSSTQRIPHSIHQVWLGITGDLPHIYKKWQKSWKKIHPSWRSICWSNNLLKKSFPLNLYNQKTFDLAKQKRNYAKAADVARYEIIEKYGGVYIDCDTQCLEPFDTIHQLYDFYGVNESDNYLLVTNCIFGSIPKHPFLQACLKNIKAYENGEIPIPSSYNEGPKVLLTTGPGLMTLSIWKNWEKKSQENYKNIIFPSKYLCPHRWLSAPTEFPLQSLCFHNFNCDIKKGNHWSLIN